MTRPLVFRWAFGSWSATIVALGLLVAFAFYADGHRSYGGCARKNTKAAIHTVQEAMIHYQTDHTEACPPSLQTLVVEHYLMRLPRDQWGEPLQFVCPGSHNPDDADITSAGKDRRFGTADDIHSWEL
jgi:hypothetical protein